MKLSGWLFVIAGVIVGGVSGLMYFNGKSKLGLFLLAGIAMTVFGIIRVFIDRVGPNEKEREKLARELPSAQARNYTLSTIPRICGMCSSKNNPQASFCGHCGHRL